MKQFSSELIAILAVGAALGGLVLQQGHRLDNRIDTLDARMEGQERRTNDQFLQLTGQMNEQYRQLNERMDERFRQLNERMDGRFRQIDERFQQIDGRFRQIDGRFQQIDGRFQQIDERIQNLSERVARVEGKFDLFETVVARQNESQTEPPAEPERIRERGG